MLSSIHGVIRINAPPSIPDWLSKQHKKSLKKDALWQSRIELIQDLSFPTAPNKLVLSGQYIIGTGVYKPQIRVWDTMELGMKFERHTDAETVDFVALEEWSKLVLVQSDRGVEFHARNGVHHRMRVPKQGRCIAYHPATCEVYVGASSTDMYRISLTEGRFMTPVGLPSMVGREDTSLGVNAVVVSPAHGLVCIGTDAGGVDLYDPRMRECVGVLTTPFSMVDSARSAVTSLACAMDGLNLAVGGAEGQVAVWDLRDATAPWSYRRHDHGSRIHTLSFVDASPVTIPELDSLSGWRIASTDLRGCKIWDVQSKKMLHTLEPPDGAAVNSMLHIPDSGLMMLSCEMPDVQVFHVPSVGPAPRWCSFLDTLIEEEATTESMQGKDAYAEYKFVTRKELSSLGLDHLVGTELLRAYMHGYFMDLRLYQKAKSIADPFAWEEHRRKRIEEKLSKERESRIRVKKVGVKVNAKLMEKMMEGKKGKKKGNAEAMVSDERFKDMFEDPEFEAEEEVEVKRRGYRIIESEDEETDREDQASGDEDSMASGHSSDDSDYDLGGRRGVKKKDTWERRALQKQQPKERKQVKPKKVRMYEGASVTKGHQGGDSGRMKSFGERIQEKSNATSAGPRHQGTRTTSRSKPAFKKR